MATIEPKKVILKNSTELLVRSLNREDAVAAIAYINQISKESSNLTFSPGEFSPSVEEEASFFEIIQQDA